jgi:transcription initiation factor TFIIH subunit 1
MLLVLESFVALEDLLEKTAAPAKTLRIDDPSRYFASVAETETTEEAPDAKRRKTEHFEFGEAVSNAAAAMRFASDKKVSETSSPAVDVAAARFVLDELSSASRRLAAASKSGASWGGSLSNGNLSALDALSDSDQAALGSIDSTASRDAATAAELLKHFWSAAPLTSVVRWEKASRVVSALGTLYDRMDLRKKALPNGARHVFAQRCRPLVSAMDGAFSFFDDEKRLRRSAYAAYEKREAAATKDSETEKKSVGGPEAPIEVS